MVAHILHEPGEHTGCRGTAGAESPLWTISGIVENSLDNTDGAFYTLNPPAGDRPHPSEFLSSSFPEYKKLYGKP